MHHGLLFLLFPLVGMAIGKALGIRSVPGASYISQLTITGDSNSYVTGGIVLAPSDFGFQDSIDFVIPVARATTSAALWPQWVPNAVPALGGALRLITSSTGAELGNGSSSASQVFDLYAFGR